MSGCVLLHRPCAIRRNMVNTWLFLGQAVGVRMRSAPSSMRDTLQHGLYQSPLRIKPGAGPGLDAHTSGQCSYWSYRRPSPQSPENHVGDMSWAAKEPIGIACHVPREVHDAQAVGVGMRSAPSSMRDTSQHGWVCSKFLAIQSGGECQDAFCFIVHVRYVATWFTFGNS